jgi:serine protease Do
MIATKIWSLVLVGVFWWFAFLTPVFAESEHPVIDVEPITQPLRTPSMATIEFARLRSGVLPGVVIGGHYGGFLKILQQRYTATSEFDDRFEDSVRYLIEEELNQAGFNILRSHSNSVFDEASDDLEPGRFLIGGTITHAKLNSYSSWLGDVTQDERTIRWEVFDRDRAKVIYRQETTGSAQAEGIDNPAATYDAIRASLKRLVDRAGFNTIIQQSQPSAVSLSPIIHEITAIATVDHPLTIAEIAGQTIPSIVRIRTALGSGSGFFIDSDMILTNQHVVDSAFSVKVDLYDGSTRTGRVLKRDAALDAALVKLDGEAASIVALPVCQTNALRVGDPVVAVGNPLSLSNSVTQGIVSGFRRGTGRSLIQTDTAINPGNSGGPLLNQQGTVIGIVTEKFSSKGIEGLGFALPISEVLQRLKVHVNVPINVELNACGNQIARVDSRSGLGELR